ncbi:MAG: hypothetical protein WDO15_29510 [Bacteroidota bacterium]
MLAVATAIQCYACTEATTMNEVVVTALGIKRDKQSLGYATQELAGDGLVEARDSNFTNQLSGKVAGLNISFECRRG